MKVSSLTDDLKLINVSSASVSSNCFGIKLGKRCIIVTKPALDQDFIGISVSDFHGEIKDADISVVTSGADVFAAIRNFLDEEGEAGNAKGDNT